VAVATRCPSANEESEKHATAQDEHNDDNDDRDEDGEHTRSTVLVCDIEQKHGMQPSQSVEQSTTPEGRRS
jgi:hypothetical protein